MSSAESLLPDAYEQTVDLVMIFAGLSSERPQTVGDSSFNTPLGEDGLFSNDPLKRAEIRAVILGFLATLEHVLEYQHHEAGAPTLTRPPMLSHTAPSIGNSYRFTSP
jgi:hypothetical protein